MGAEVGVNLVSDFRIRRLDSLQLAGLACGVCGGLFEAAATVDELRDFGR